MSAESKPQLPNDVHDVNAASVPAGSTPETEATPTVPNFRKGFMKDSKFEVLMGMGEDPREYREMMQSLLEDLQPRRGLESHLVEQMGETFWRMRRSQRIRDGVALKNIRAKVPGEDMAATVRSSQAFEAMEPFERLEKALSRRGQGPTAAEIEEFVSSREERPFPSDGGIHHPAEFARPTDGREGPQGRPAQSPQAARGPARTLRDSRHAVHDSVGASPRGGESRRADGSRGSEIHVSPEVRGRELSPAVAPDQRLREGPAGGTRKKRC